MKKILYIFFVSFGVTFSQTNPSQNQNYIHTIGYQKPFLQSTVENSQIDDIDKIESVTYYDGLGRALQSNTVRGGGGGLGIDIITPIIYDGLGRTAKQYLPFPKSAGAGAFETGPIPLQESFYANNYPEDISGSSPFNTFSETRFETSPLNRVLEQGAPGDDWEIDPILDTDHTIKYQHSANAGSSVYLFRVSFNSGNTDQPILELDSNTFWPTLTLYSTQMRDENWTTSDGSYGRTFEYKNQLGQVVLKRTNLFDPLKGPSNPNYHDTYYVYDDFGNLTYVLSPEASDLIVDSNGDLVSNASQILDDLGYQYKYDHRNRLIEKKLPGKGWESIVYDKLDRPVLTQDEKLDAQNIWLFTKYDALGRVAYTGKFTNSGSRTTLQTAVNAYSEFYENRSASAVTVGDTDIYYTSSQTYPTSNLEVLTVNYYDSYVDNDGMDFPNTVYDQSVLQVAKGLPTVSRVRVLETADWIWSQIGYDSKGRAIFNISQNDYLGTLDVSMSDLDFTGKLLESYSGHQRPGFEQIITHDYFTYDHMGRIISHKQKINQEEVQLISYNAYDELGQLDIKGVGGVTYVSGYTDLVDADVDSNGKITKASSTSGWSARAKTRGVIPSLFEGGIDVIVSQNDRLVRMGLIFNGSGTQGNNYFDYGIELNASNEAYLVIYGTTATTYLTDYLPGDLFRIERVKVGAQYNIKYYHNNDVIHTITDLGLTEVEKILTGKVSFNGSIGSVDIMSLFGPYLDKRLQVINYKYNIRGWLTDINDVGSTTKGLDEYNDLFSFRINYNKVQNTGSPIALYNGNISQTLWKTDNDNTNIHAYNYSYDHLNRITAAKSISGADMNNLAVTDTYNLSGVTYDKNGNINVLNRYGKDSPSAPDVLWDGLTYTYNANQLINVADTGTVSGFLDGNTNPSQNGDDFDYDVNGNMTIDRNKGITSIAYNHLNLPTAITFGGGSTGGISYVYDATGVKLKKIVVESGNPTITTEYAGNFKYNDASGQMILEFFNHPEGYVIPTPIIPSGGGGSGEPVKGFDDGSGEITYSQYAYVFQYKDHLGNVRLSYSDTDRNGSIETASFTGGEIIEESNYYPFGLKQKGYNNTVSPNGNSLAQKWSFLGQERIDDLELNWLTFRYRNYMPDIGRFFGVDPVSADYVSISTYQFAHNNPIWKIELEGLEGATFNDEPDSQNLESVGNPSSGIQIPGEMAYATSGGGRGSSNSLPVNNQGSSYTKALGKVNDVIQGVLSKITDLAKQVSVPSVGVQHYVSNPQDALIETEAKTSADIELSSTEAGDIVDGLKEAYSPEKDGLGRGTTGALIANDLNELSETTSNTTNRGDSFEVVRYANNRSGTDPVTWITGAETQEQASKDSTDYMNTRVPRNQRTLYGVDSVRTRKKQ